MNDSDKQRAQALVNRLLREAADKAAAGEYKEALTAVKKAKALDQSNVFLLALERQIEQMHELGIIGLLSDEQKSDILGSIPDLVNKAVQADSALENPNAPHAGREETGEEREARVAAGRWLKNQYFQRAHDFVRKGDYEHALGELRKIFAIDDQDRVARDFEVKIEQMLEIRRHQPAALRAEGGIRAAAVEPAVPSEPVGSGEDIKEPGAPRGRSRAILIAVIVTTIIALLAVVYFWKRQHATPAVPRIQESAQEKTEEIPVYPVPPPQIPSDTSRADTSAGN